MYVPNLNHSFRHHSLIEISCSDPSSLPFQSHKPFKAQVEITRIHNNRFQVIIRLLSGNTKRFGRTCVKIQVFFVFLDFSFSSMFTASGGGVREPGACPIPRPEHEHGIRNLARHRRTRNNVQQPSEAACLPPSLIINNQNRNYTNKLVATVLLHILDCTKKHLNSILYSSKK